MSDGGFKWKEFMGGWDTANSQPYLGIWLYAYTPGTGFANHAVNGKNFFDDEDPAVASSQTKIQGSSTKDWVDGYFNDDLYDIEIRDSDDVTILKQITDVRFNADAHILDDGTAYPSAGANNRYQGFIKRTAGNVIQEFGVNDGTAFRTLVKKDSNDKFVIDNTGSIDFLGIPNLERIEAYVNAVNPSYQVDIKAEIISLYDPSTGLFKLIDFSGSTYTADITTSGANGLDTGSEAGSTWYYIWLIAKEDGTKASLLSEDYDYATVELNLPADYIYLHRVGAVYNDSGSDLEQFMQRGKNVIVENVDHPLQDPLDFTNSGANVPIDIVSKVVGSLQILSTGAGSTQAALSVTVGGTSIGELFMTAEAAGATNKYICNFALAVNDVHTINLDETNGTASGWITGWELW